VESTLIYYNTTLRLRAHQRLCGILKQFPFVREQMLEEFCIRRHVSDLRHVSDSLQKGNVDVELL